MFIKSTQVYVRMRCKKPKCPWYIFGAKDSKSGVFQVIAYTDKHNCNPVNKIYKFTHKKLADFLFQTFSTFRNEKNWLTKPLSSWAIELRDTVGVLLGLTNQLCFQGPHQCSQSAAFILPLALVSNGRARLIHLSVGISPEAVVPKIVVWQRFQSQRTNAVIPC